jgi:hypothetical protein
MLFPWIGIFEQIKLANTFVNYNDVQFSKGSFTNRVQIKTPEGYSWLTIPLKKFSLGTKINAIEINNSTDWRNKHLSTLHRCYKGAPFATEMIEIVESIYAKQTHYLTEICEESVKSVCQYFDLITSTNFVDVITLKIEGKSSQRVLDIVKRLDGSQYITGHGAKNYLEHHLFEDNNIEVRYMDYNKALYPQLHNAFNPYVSIIDLIANTGRQGHQFIQSQTTNWREFINE